MLVKSGQCRIGVANNSKERPKVLRRNQCKLGVANITWELPIIVRSG